MALSSRGPDAPEALVSFCAGLYQELFYTIVELMNKALSSNSACAWISVSVVWKGDSPHMVSIPCASITTSITVTINGYLV